MRTHLGGPALFRLVRYWSRRWASNVDTGGDVQVGHVMVLEAIDAAGAGGPAQIAAVADELGLDRSNASRMLSAAVAAGLVTKTVSPSDSRRTELAVTDAGTAVLAAARAWQQQTFERLTAGWPAADARRFAGYLARLANQTYQEAQP
jgi:DNA-binding MarR family transcriptional regulator